LPNRSVIPSSGKNSDFRGHFFLPRYATGVWFLRGKMLIWRKRERYAKTGSHIVGIDAGGSLDWLEYMAVSNRLANGQCGGIECFGRRIGAGRSRTGDADSVIGKASVADESRKGSEGGAADGHCEREAGARRAEKIYSRSRGGKG
jgi:hypothetical protein